MDDLTTNHFPYHQMTDGVLQVDASHRIKNADAAFCSWLDMRKPELIGRFWPSLFHPLERPTIDTMLEKFCHSGEAHSLLQGMLNNHNNDQLYLQLHRPLDDPHSDYFCLIMNLGERVNYTNTKRHYERLFEISNDLLCIANTMGYFLQVNPGFTRLLGFTREELIDRSFLDFIHPDDIDSTLNEIRNLRFGTDTRNFENRYRCKDGTWRWLAWSTPAPGDDGLLFAVAKDITERKALESKLSRMAKYDVLTGLPNKIYLEDELKRAMARVMRDDRLIAGFYIELLDLDNLTRNTSQAARDDLIIQFGIRLRRLVRTNDFVACIGEHAFFVMAELEEARLVEIVEKKLQRAMNMEFHWKGQSFSIRSSIGVALFHSSTHCDPTDFIASANLISSETILADVTFQP